MLHECQGQFLGLLCWNNNENKIDAIVSVVVEVTLPKIRSYKILVHLGLKMLYFIVTASESYEF